MSTPSYAPGVFNVDGIDAAKRIILNPDGVRSPQERWEVETEYLLGLLADWMPLSGAAVLDWGCGIGRLSRPLIERHGCAVLGVDISQPMRMLAVEYVNSTSFLCCDPSAARVLARFGAQFDCALAVWALQHVADLGADVEAIADMLRPGGRLFILNSLSRFVPVMLDGEFQWIEDGADLFGPLQHHFVPLTAQWPDAGIVPAPPAIWAVFEKPSVEG